MRARKVRQAGGRHVRRVCHDEVARRLGDEGVGELLAVLAGEHDRLRAVDARLQRHLHIGRADRIHVVGLVEPGERVERAGGEHVERLLVALARLKLRQVVREVGRLQHQRAAAGQRRERVDQSLPLRPAGPDRQRHRQHRHARQGVGEEGQQRADPVIHAGEARILHVVVRRHQPPRGGGVGGDPAEHGVEAVRRRRERLARLLEMVGEEHDHAVVAAMRGEPDAARHEMGREQVVRHRHAGELHRRRRDRRGVRDRLRELAGVEIEARIVAVARGAGRCGGDRRRANHQQQRHKKESPHGLASRKFAVWAMW